MRSAVKRRSALRRFRAPLVIAAWVLLAVADLRTAAGADVILQDSRSSAIVRATPILSSGSPGLVLEHAEYGVLAPNLSGQLFLEIPQTLGRGRLEFAFAYTFAEFQRTDGEVPDARNRNGTLVSHPLDAAHIFYVSGTAGLTDRLDVNLAIPATYQNYAGGKQLTLHDELVVDPVVVRLKHFLSPRGKANAVDLAGGLGFSVRTDQGAYGEPEASDRFVLSPALFASVQRLGHYSLRWSGPVPLRPYVNAGFDITALDVRFTQFRWGVGLDAQVIRERLTTGIAFLGRNELASVRGVVDDYTFTGEEIRRASVDPRRDFFDLSIGGRLILWSNFGSAGPRSLREPRSLMLIANLLVSLNDDGLRAPAIPTVGLEYVF